MVTSMEQPQGTDESVDIIEPVVSEGDGVTGEDESTSTSETEDTTSFGDMATRAEDTAAPPVASEPPPPEPEAVTPTDQRTIQELQELQRRRADEKQREWREQVGRRARAYEQQLEEQGYMPEQAKEQARQYVRQEQRFQKQQEEASNMVGFLQGRQAAAVHYMKKHGLADQQMLDDFIALQQTNSPAEMEKEVRRIRSDRDLRAENARLKQGRVPPQTFDNSQGAAEVSSNDDRLLDAYNNGDRSEAAVRAARRLALGA